MSVLGSSKTETTWVAASDVVDFNADLLHLIDFKLSPSKDFIFNRPSSSEAKMDASATIDPFPKVT